MDYFKLFGFAPRPWLDSSALNQKYQELTLAQHPDRGGRGANHRVGGAVQMASSFADVTEGYRVLSEDKLRLRHLLELAGVDLPRHDMPPEDLLDVFLDLGDFLQNSDRLLELSAKAQNALAKSLLEAERVRAREQATEFLTQLEVMQSMAVAELRAQDAIWSTDQSSTLPRLTDLARRFAYLGRWIEQLREREFKLTEAATI